MRYGSHVKLKAALAALGWKVARYRLIGQVPAESGIMLGGPHTSNGDFVAMVGVAWSQDRPLKALVKKSWFIGPAGWLFRALGGIPVDRSNPGAIVEELTAAGRNKRDFHLVIAPKGTRSPRPYWKSGFYRIGLAAGLPVTLASIDGHRREVEIGPTIMLTGDARADMDIIRAFYADKAGVHPQLRSEPRLREEDYPERLRGREAK